MSPPPVEPKKPRPVRRFVGGVFRATGSSILTIGMFGTALAAGGFLGLAISFRNLPDVRTLQGYAPPETSYIYDIKGKLLTSIHGEAHREVVPLNKISPHLKRAVLAIEDSNFYSHHGINPNSIGRAIVVNSRSGGVREGASTITMQLVKNLLLSKERTYSRKLAEGVLAVRVEHVFEKDEILEQYLNTIYWGHNAYGVQTAAESYFSKDAAALNLAESAMMAGLIQAPEVHSPFRNYDLTKQRQAQVLNRMATLGWITEAEAEAAKKTPLRLGKPTAWLGQRVPFVTDAVISELNRRFGAQAIQKGGMRVQTTIDLDFQRRTLEAATASFQRRVGAGLKADQFALVAIDPRTHFVKAMIGGADYSKSQFNRATQSQRQPGSSFKPFVYYTAFASGNWTPSSVIDDKPVQYRDGSGFYTPKNYGGGYSGEMTLRAALISSANVPAVVLGQKVGLAKVVELCRLLGIESPIDTFVSLPLGSVGITPMEMAGAYATFASNGWHSDPTIIARVTDSQGVLLLDNTPEPQLVLDPWATATLSATMQGVIHGGTGTLAYIGRQAAGKTGTTDSERDVWFVGYVPQLAAAVWIGNDNYTPMGERITGGGYAAPIWRDFMQEALKDEPAQFFPPASNFPEPEPTES
ncbi:MAG: penicillin-binding protein 1A [Cyanobacteria bacterium P01_H01_bin.15]